jgi:sporulation-control protein
MFGKILASLNIGGTIVDTILEKKELRQGEKVGGQLRLVGGKSEQKINNATLTLVCEYRYDHKKSVKHTWKQVKIGPIGTIRPQEEKVIPFQLEVPETMPCTFHDYLREGFCTNLITDLDIPFAINPHDNDEVTIQPHRDLQLLLDILESLGMKVVKMSGPMVPFGSTAPAFPYYQSISLESGGLVSATVSLLWKGNGEIKCFLGRNSRMLNISASDHEEGGERMKALFEKELGVAERKLVNEVLERLGIDRDPARFYRLRIPERYRPYCTEFSLEYLHKNLFELELDQKRKGLKSMVDDMLDLDERKIRFRVNEEDLRDRGKRIEALIIDSFEQLKPNGTEKNT